MNVADRQQEFEDLDSMFRSAGWQRYKAHVAQQWGTPAQGGGARFQQAVGVAANEMEDDQTTAKLRQVIFAQKEIQSLIVSFEGKIDHLKPLEQRELAPSRRGSL